MAGAGALRVREERFAALTAPANEKQTWEAILARVAGGWEAEGGAGFAKPKSIWEICKKLDVPYLQVMRWIVSDEGRWKEYLEVGRFTADAMVNECVPIADSATPETVGVARTQIEARLKVAARLDRERFGELANAVVQPPVTINIGVRRETGEVAGRVIEAEAQEQIEI